MIILSTRVPSLYNHNIQARKEICIENEFLKVSSVEPQKKKIALSHKYKNNVESRKNSSHRSISFFCIYCNFSTKK